METWEIPRGGESTAAASYMTADQARGHLVGKNDVKKLVQTHIRQVERLIYQRSKLMQKRDLLYSIIDTYLDVPADKIQWALLYHFKRQGFTVAPKGTHAITIQW